MLKKGYLQSFAGTEKLSANFCHHPWFRDRGVVRIKGSLFDLPHNVFNCLALVFQKWNQLVQIGKAPYGTKAF